MTKISVIVPVYNNSKYVTTTLESIIETNYSNLELIISDDGSTDNSVEKILNFIEKYPNINVIMKKNIENLGTAKNILSAVLSATGEYIFICAADDIFLKERIELSLKAFKEEKAFAVFGDTIIIDENGNETNLIYTNAEHVNNSNLIVEQLKRNQCLGATLSFINDKSLFIEKGHLMFDKSDDFGFILECINQYKKIYYIKNPLMKYRRHSNNQSANTYKMRMLTQEVTSKYSLQYLSKSLEDVYQIDKYNIQLAWGIQECSLERYAIAREIFGLIGNSMSNLCWEFYFYKSVVLYVHEELEKAFESLTNSLEKKNSHAATHNNMGVILFELGEISQSRRCFEKAIFYKNDYLDAIDNLKFSEDKGNYKPKFTYRTVFNQYINNTDYILGKELRR
ncbi:Glycosyltransferase involved in cell wall bisynthesis [Paenisporosarcina quisquiliarum]|nr:Glycosyltransferase involved in cell wall bisynthesis [Paenisporosarcina quisquiliarum]